MFDYRSWRVGDVTHSCQDQLFPATRVTSSGMSPKVASATVFVPRFWDQPRQKQAQTYAWNALRSCGISATVSARLNGASEVVLQLDSGYGITDADIMKLSGSLPIQYGREFRATNAPPVEKTAPVRAVSPARTAQCTFRNANGNQCRSAAETMLNGYPVCRNHNMTQCHASTENGARCTRASEKKMGQFGFCWQHAHTLNNNPHWKPKPGHWP